MVLRLMGRDESSLIISHNENARERSEARNGKVNKTKLNSQSINVGGMFNQDSVLFRKQLARKRAMKLINDAWGGDKKIDQNLDEIRSNSNEARANISEYNDYIKEFKAKKDELREYYDIDNGDYTKEDFDLLKKKQDAAGDPGITFTQEERDRLAQLEDSSLAKYVEQTAGLDAAIKNYEDKLEDEWNKVSAYNSEIRGIKIERLKYHDMLDAQKKADEINAAASKEAIGMLIGEAQDHIKEELEEKFEEAKEKAEEKEEREEKLEEQREEKEKFEEQLEIKREDNRDAQESRIEQEKNAREQADIIEGARRNSGDPSSLPSDIKAEIKEMLQKMKLLEEDLKGAEIDDTI